MDQSEEQAKPAASSFSLLLSRVEMELELSMAGDWQVPWLWCWHVNGPGLWMADVVMWEQK